MKLILLLIFTVFVYQAFANCPTSKKISCAAAMVGCASVCACDIPVCECCPGCIACVSATVADCCECLFPCWSGCTDKKLMTDVLQYSKLFVNKTMTTNQCLCYLGGGQYSCGAVFNGQACCNSKWCPCNPDTSPCQCATALC